MIPLQSKFKGNAALVNRFKTPPFHGGMTGSTPVRGTMGLTLVLTAIEVEKDDASRIRLEILKHLSNNKRSRIIYNDFRRRYVFRWC